MLSYPKFPSYLAIPKTIPCRDDQRRQRWSEKAEMQHNQRVIEAGRNLLRPFSSTSLLKQAQLHQAAQDHIGWVLSIPPNTHSTASLCNLLQCLTTLTAKTSIFSCSDGDSCVFICPHCPLHCHWALVRRVWCPLHSHQCTDTHWQEHRIMEWFRLKGP